MTAFLWYSFVIYVLQALFACAPMGEVKSNYPDAAKALVNTALAFWVGILLFG